MQRAQENKQQFSAAAGITNQKRLSDTGRMKQTNQTFINGAKSRADFNIQLLLLGETGVGKSSLLYRYAEGEFRNGFVGTNGIDHKEKNLEYLNHSVKM